MHTFSTELGGRPLTIETGKIAKQANGSVLIRYGETAVVVAVTGTDTPREGVDFFPLTVDFEEKMYAVGKIPGGFLRREGRPPETAILTSRLIDRPIRPMFPDGYHNDVQIVATAVSVDPDNAPDIPAMIGASCALSISDIPFEGPIAGVRVGRVDGKFIINDLEQAAVSEMNVAVAGTKEAILMVEAGAKEVSEQVMLDAILFGHEEIKKLVAFQEQIQAEVGKPKMEFTLMCRLKPFPRKSWNTVNRRSTMPSWIPISFIATRWFPKPRKRSWNILWSFILKVKSILPYCAEACQEGLSSHHYP